MLNLGDVLDFIIYRFNQGAFSQENLVCNTHQGVLHVVLHLGNQLDAIKEQVFEKSLPDISFVRTEFSLDVLQEPSPFQRLPVIHITWCEHEIENFSLVIDDQMEFEAEEPSHGTFATFSKSLKGLVNQCLSCWVANSLQKSSAIQYISVILDSVNMVVIA